MRATLYHYTLALLSLMLLTSCDRCSDVLEHQKGSLRIQLLETSTSRATYDTPAGEQAVSKVSAPITLYINGGQAQGGMDVTITDPAQVAQAYTAEGLIKDINCYVRTVSMASNMAGGVEPNVITLNDGTYTHNASKGEIQAPLLACEAEAAVETVVAGKTVYTVTLEPKPMVSRFEVYGQIKPQSNEKTKQCAYEKIQVAAVFFNNLRTSYLSNDRTLVKMSEYYDYEMAGKAVSLLDFWTENEKTKPVGLPDGTKFGKTNVMLFTKNGDNDLTGPLDPKLVDPFERGERCVSHLFFPKGANESLGEGESPSLPGDYPFNNYYDHIILALRISYKDPVMKLTYDKGKDYRTIWLTLRRFMFKNEGDLDVGFKAGYTYRLDLNELSPYFKTHLDGSPDEPTTYWPEPLGYTNIFLTLEVVPFVLKNVTPDLSDYITPEQ